MTDVNDMTVADLENVIIGRKAAEQRARDEAMAMMAGSPASPGKTFAQWRLTRDEWEKLGPDEKRRAAKEATIF